MLNKIYTCAFTRSDGTEKEIEFNIPVNTPVASEIECTGLRLAWVTTNRTIQLNHNAGYAYAQFTIDKHENFVSCTILNINTAWLSLIEETDTTLVYQYKAPFSSEPDLSATLNIKQTYFENLSTNVQTTLNNLFIKVSL